MAEQNEKIELGDPINSYQLSKDLLRTLTSSELFKTGRENPYVFFDIMMGIAEFTRVVLKSMEASSKNNRDFYKFYKDCIMENINLSSEELIFRFANLEEVS